MKYPFRFYGREPADWHYSSHGFLYDIQFAKAPDQASRKKLREMAERIFSEGPASLGELWVWGERFLLFSIHDRYGDSAHMIFTYVAEFLSAVHQNERLRDVVFCNGVGSRSDRWDSWTLKQSAEPDKGPKHPDAPWASLLRRSEDPSLSWELGAALPEINAAAPPPPAPRNPRVRTVKAGLRVERAALLPMQEGAEHLDAGWAKIEKSFTQGGQTLNRVSGLKVPLGLIHKGGKNTAIVCLNGDGVPHSIELPPYLQTGLSVGVEPDGIHGIAASFSEVWSFNLSEGTIRIRFAAHENNGYVQGVAWVSGNLWAVRFANQVMLLDLSEESWIYAGTQQPSGSLVGSFRHGTMLAFVSGDTLSVIGIGDWQCKVLGSISTKGRRAVIVNDALYLLSKRIKEKAGRVMGFDEEYEAWAAPIRRQAEQNRELRFKSQEKIYWKWINANQMPADKRKLRIQELDKIFNGIAFSMKSDGTTLVAVQRPGFNRSRGAKFIFCTPDNQQLPVEASLAWSNGVTNFSLTKQRDAFFFVSGLGFQISLVELKGGSTICDVKNFSTRGGLFYDIIAKDRKNFLAIWNNSLDWHQEQDTKWVVKESRALDFPRGNLFDEERSLLYLMQQSTERLLVFRWTDTQLTQELAFTDAVKEISIRDGRFFAQMLDGQWFELMGYEPQASEASITR